MSGSCLDRFKWPNSRALRFDWSEILDRKDPLTDRGRACTGTRWLLTAAPSVRKPGRECPQACVPG